MNDTVILNTFENIGFHIIKIDDTINQTLDTLFANGNIPNKIIEKTRENGYNIHSKYWVNLTLSKIGSDEDLVLIPNIRENELIDGVIRPLFATRKEEEEFIKKNKDNLKEEIYKKIKKAINNYI